MLLNTHLYIHIHIHIGYGYPSRDADRHGYPQPEYSEQSAEHSRSYAGSKPAYDYGMFLSYAYYVYDYGMFNSIEIYLEISLSHDTIGYRIIVSYLESISIFFFILFCVHFPAAIVYISVSYVPHRYFRATFCTCTFILRLFCPTPTIRQSCSRSTLAGC